MNFSASTPIKLMLVLLVAATLMQSTNAVKVAFRLDDLQDFWITASQQRVMDTFKNRNLPLTVGIITHDWGQDASMLNYMKNALSSGWDVEISCHGDQHIDFTTQTLAQQSALLAACRTGITNTLGSGFSLTTFIPPYNEWNANTLTALAQNGYTYFSARTGNDPVSNTNWATGPIYHVPIGSQTADDNANIYPWSKVWTDTQAQIAAYGFAAVMLHPQDFVTNGNPDDSKFQQLDSLINAIQAAGHQFVNLRELVTTGGGGVTTTTKAPTTTTTTKAPTTTTTTTKAPGTTTTTKAPGTTTTTTTTKAPGTTTTTKAPGTTTTTAAPSGSVCQSNYDCVYGTCANGQCTCNDRWCKNANGKCDVESTYNWNTMLWECAGGSGITTTTTKAPSGTTTTTKAPSGTTTTTKAPGTTTTTKAPSGTTTTTKAPSGSVCQSNYDCVYGACANGQCTCYDRWCKNGSGKCDVPTEYNWNTAQWVCP